jgi:galacturan 1,4-alpha-galacturonidase
MSTQNEAVVIKIAYIGGGSRYWARLLMTDLALCPHLEGEIALYDIDYEAAMRNVAHAKGIYGHPDAKTTFAVYAYHTAEEALEGADFVVLSILPGPMQMFANDLDIPAHYGILQTVGDTTGPGGISRALRSVPIYLDYAHQIMDLCPEAWVINYTNPMTLCTAALYAATPDIKAFGCCHEVFGTQRRLAGIVAEHLDVPRPPRQAIKTDVAGVNHFTFAPTAHWQGPGTDAPVDLYPVVARYLETSDVWTDHTAWSKAMEAQGQWFTSRGKVAFEFFRRYGVLGAAGDRHLMEFVPWYLGSEAAVHRYGVRLTPSSYRLGTWQPPQNAPQVETSAEEKDAGGLTHSGEEGVAQMMALLGIEPLDTNVNLPNMGQMPAMPLGAVVETNAQFRKDRLIPVVPKPLPEGVRALVRRIVDVQAMTLEAAIHRDKDLAFQALLDDPLCRIPVDQAGAMFNELLEANAAMLPGW